MVCEGNEAEKFEVFESRKRKKYRAVYRKRVKHRKTPAGAGN